MLESVTVGISPNLSWATMPIAHIHYSISPDADINLFHCISYAVDAHYCISSIVSVHRS